MQRGDRVSIVGLPTLGQWKRYEAWRELPTLPERPRRKTWWQRLIDWIIEGLGE